MVWVHGDLHRPSLGRGRNGLRLTDLTSFMAPGAWLPVTVLVLAAAGGIFIHSKAQGTAGATQPDSSPALFVFVFIAVVFTSVSVAVMYREVQLQREARRSAPSSATAAGAERGGAQGA